MTGHLEIEDKYDVDTTASVPDMHGVPGVARVDVRPAVKLSATYFDAADRSLAQAGIALRRREGGYDEGWHIKVIDEGGKREFFSDLTDSSVVPRHFEDALMPFTAGAGLHPIAELRTIRSAYILCSEGGSVLAEVVDDLVVGRRLDGAAATRRQKVEIWREWEVELVAGDVSLLALIAQPLTHAGAAPSASSSKLSRVMGEAVVPPDAKGLTAAEQIASVLTRGAGDRP